MVNYDKWDAIDDSDDEEDRQARDAEHNQTMMLLGMMLADAAPHLSEQATARLVRFIAVVASSPWTDAAQQHEMAKRRGKLIVDVVRRDGEPSLPALVALCRDAKAQHDAYVAGQRGDGRSKEAASRALIACMAALNILSATRSYEGGAPKLFARLAAFDEEDDVAADIVRRLGAYQFARDALDDYPPREEEPAPMAAATTATDVGPEHTPAVPGGGDEWAEEAERDEATSAPSPERSAAIKRAAEMIAAKRPPSQAVAAAERSQSGETSALRSFARTFSRQLLLQAGFISFGLVLGVVLRYLGLGKEAKPHLPADRLLSFLGVGDAREL